MKRLLKSVLIGVSCLLFVACGSKSPYPGLKQMKNGAYMKFYNKNDKEVMPRLKDEVTFEMAQYFNDTLLFTTAGTEPMTLVLREADFKGDVVDGLLMMHVGDSAQLAVLSDSVFMTMLQMDVPEEYAGKPIYYELKLLSVKPYEILEAERKVLLDSLRQAELDFLAPLREDAKNTVTESGLIVLEQLGKGRTAQMGEYVNFDFTMCGPKGDTIMHSFGIEPVEMQYGEEFISAGFNEALGMVPEGGTMRFVLPSELAFDSVGYESHIDPYTPLVVLLKMNSVMDKAAYDKKMEALQVQKEAEAKRLMSLEQKTMEDYLKANGITEQPTESGLVIIRKEEGIGPVAQWGDEVTVHYVMSNLKGELLESSYEYEHPVTFKIGNNEMLPAIEEAVMTMSKGSKVSLVSPSALAFGDFVIDEDLLPAYSPLKIDLELVEIK
ncbi:MAG: FKBP-type peptidyl-prolyl cis-trans isomerase [Bacteroidales bacterium]|nr:FKBP-type peptidyl-prolyl cis-trans isomerase [Bacteroidales bacterium]